MLQLIETFTNTAGFSITPFYMENIGFIFIPKEIENQLGYENLSHMIKQSKSFTEGIEYTILRNESLLQMKELLKQSMTSSKKLYEYIKFFPSLIALSEAGLYTVMILSRKPDAQTFRRWITCEVIPSIREKSLHKLHQKQDHYLTSDLSELSLKMDTIQKIVAEQHNTIKDLSKIIFNQQQFQQFIFQILERIETSISESLPHDMFEGWKKVKNIVKDMEKLYSLSEREIKEYIQKLCYDHDVNLPDKRLWTKEISFYTFKEIAVKIGIYSTTGKPHFKFISILIQYLDLKHEQGNKYSSQTVDVIREWLHKRSYPQSIKLKKDRISKSFKLRYKSNNLQ